LPKNSKLACETVALVVQHHEELSYNVNEVVEKIDDLLVFGQLRITVWLHRASSMGEQRLNEPHELRHKLCMLL